VLIAASVAVATKRFSRGSMLLGLEGCIERQGLRTRCLWRAIPVNISMPVVWIFRTRAVTLALACAKVREPVLPVSRELSFQEPDVVVVSPEQSGLRQSTS
jgi:hypothetical protein